MKSKLLIFFTVVLLFIFVGCAEENKTNSPKSTNTITSTNVILSTPSSQSTGTGSNRPTDSVTGAITSAEAPTPGGTSTPSNVIDAPVSGTTASPTSKPTAKPTEKPTPTPQGPTVKFSANGGIYSKALEVKLTADPGYTIYYTTDGSDPKTNGKKYSSPIKVQESTGNVGYLTQSIASSFRYAAPSSQIVGTTIKAYAKNGSNIIDTVTNTYIVSSDFANNYNLPSISISIKPTDFATSSGIYVSVMNDPFGTKERKVAFFELFDRSGSKVAGQYIELSMHGNGSLGNQQKSFRMYFKKDANPDVLNNPGKLKYDIFEGRVYDSSNENIDSYKRLLLRNSGNDCTCSMLRDALMQRICKGMNVDYMETQPATVFINGEFWGLYNIRERYDAKYFESHYGVLEENFVMLEAPSPLKSNTSKPPYEVNDGLPGDEVPFNNLVSYARNHDLSNATYYNYVANQVDVDSLIDFYICNLYFCNIDWPSNNIKVWRNKNPEDPSGLDTKWRFVLLDMDHGCSYANDYKFDMMNRINNNSILSDLMYALLANNGFKQKFIDRFDYVTKNIFTVNKMTALLDDMSKEIRPIVSLHSQRWSTSGFSTSKWNSEISKIKTFLENRTHYATKQFNEYFNLAPINIGITFSDGISSATVNSKSVSSGSTVAYSVGEKVTLKATVKSGYTFAGIAISTADGKQTFHSSTSVTITVTGKMTISVLARKTGFTASEALVAGSRTIFYLKSNGDLYAWGASENGQGGIFTGTSLLPVSLVMTSVKQVSTSQGGNVGDDPHTLILSADGKLYAVGNNNYNQTGYSGDEYYTLRPVSGVPSGTIAEISAGYDHSLILMTNGDLYGIGNNEKGQLGSANYKGKVTTFTKIATNVTSMAAGRRHTVYVKGGKMYGLGDNRWKKLTSSSTEVFTSPVQISTKTITKVFAGEHSTFCIDSAGDLYYFGWRSTSTFSTGAGDGQLHKVMSNVASASMQDEHAIIVTKDGKIYGWGLNSYNQVSTSSSASSFSTPQLISSSAKTGAAGSWFSAILNKDGSVTVWGKNEYGISGTGSYSNKIGKTTISSGKFSK